MQTDRAIRTSPLPTGRAIRFFEQTQFQRLLGNNLLQSPCLTAKVRHFAARGRTRRVGRQPPLAGFQDAARVGDPLRAVFHPS
jgi:hypothetical protein